MTVTEETCLIYVKVPANAVAGIITFRTREGYQLRSARLWPLDDSIPEGGKGEYTIVLARSVSWDREAC